MLEKAFKLGLVLAGTPVVLVMGAVCAFDIWLAYRKDPESLDEMLDSFLNS